ncbi:MAG: YadA-like family protein [Cardiobacteriaceae bacterium]|nr:YadA-like family protein [Cardiobacteriaceae bacterium]
MNHIYRSLYNKALGTWVAVPEIAKTHGKSGNGKTATFTLPAPRFACTALASALLLASSQVMAANGKKYPTGQGEDNYCYYDTTSQSVICGDASTKVEDTYDTKPARSVAVGAGANINGENSVAVGSGATANKTGAVALGGNSKATEDQAIAVGLGAEAKGKFDISIGREAAKGANSTGSWSNIAIGDRALQNAASSDNNTAIGTGAAIGISGKHNIALGAHANSPTATGGTAVTANNTIAIGERSAATAISSIGIGNRVKATGATSVAVGNGANAEKQNAIAIGNTAQAITNNGSIAVGARTTASGTSSVAIGTDSQSSAGSTVAVGNFAKATARNAVAIGDSAQAAGTGNVALGQAAGRVAAGTAPTAIGNNTVNLGVLAGADSRGNQGQVAVGWEAGRNTTGTFNVAMGHKAGNGATANSTVAVGTLATVGHNQAIAIGSAKDNTAGAVKTEATGEASIAIGAEANASNRDATAIGKAANAAGRDGVAVGLNANAAGQGVVAIGTRTGTAATAGYVAPTDAVFIGASAGYQSTNNTRQIAIGNNAGNLVGTKASTASLDNIAIGHEAGQSINGNNNIAIGKGAGKDLGTAAAAVSDTIAIGTGAQANANKTIAIGTGNIVSGENSGAFGDPNNVSGTGSYAFGNNNTIAQDNTFVLGNDVTTTQANSVVLGNASADRAATTVSSATVGGVTYGGFAGQGSVANGVVSVGAQGKERQLINVAAGEISATSTDAINGSQLFAVANQIASGAGTHYYSVNSGAQGADSNYNNDGATGSDALAAGMKASASGVQSTAVGSEVTASGNQSLAVGNNVQATGLGATAVGNNSRATAEGAQAFGQSSVASGVNSAAIGRAARATGDRASAFGVSNTASGASSFAGGDRSAASGASSIAIGTRTRSEATRSIAVGVDSAASALAPVGGEVTDKKGRKFATSMVGATAAQGSVAIGAESTVNGTNAVAIGQASEALGQNTFAGGNDAHAIGKSSVAIGDGAQSDYDSAVAMGYKATVHQEGLHGHLGTAKRPSLGAVAIGSEASSGGEGAVAIGRKSQSTFTNATAVGHSAAAVGYNTSALGFQSKAAGVSSIAIGDKALAGIGTEEADVSKRTTFNVAIGTNTNATGENAVAMGSNAEAKAFRSTAVGVLSQVTEAQGAAFGSFSVANRAAGMTGSDILNAKDPATDASVWTATHAAFSVGNDAAHSTNRQGNGPAQNYDMPLVTRQIIGVAAGTNDTDAVNVAQLNTVAKHTKNVGDTIVNVLGGNAAITPQGNISMSDIGGTGETNIDAAIRKINNTAAAAKTTVTSNDKSVTVVHDATTNTYDLAVNTDGTTIVKDPATGALKANTAPITSVAAGQPNAGSVSVATGDEGKLATAGDIANAINNSGFTLTANGNDGSLVKPGSTVDLKNTDGNILISKDPANNEVNFDLNTIVKIGPAAGGNPITIDGDDGVISGLSNTLPATTSTGTPTTAQTAPAVVPDDRAATVGDVLNAGWNLQGNGQAKDFVRPYDTVNFVDGNGTTVEVNTDGATSTIKVNVNAQGLAESAQLPVVYTNANGDKLYKHTDGNFYTQPNGAGTQVAPADVIASMQSADGSTTTPTTLANVKAGVKDTDAVNVSQLKGAADALGGGAGIDPNTGDFKAPSYVINKTDGTQYAPANNVGDALKNLNDEVVKPITFGGDNAPANFDRTLGSEVFVKGGATGTLTDNNIGVESDGSNTLRVKLAQNVDLGNNGSVKTGNTTVNNAGITIANPADPAKNVSLTDNGLNNGGNKITNVAAGTDDTDAVNVSQLKAAAQAALLGSPVQYSDPATPTTPNGGLPTNDVTIVGQNPNAPVTVHNVAAGKAPTDAVNVGQLHQVVAANRTTVAAGDNIVVTASGNHYTVSTSPNPNFSSVRVNGNTYVDANGLNANNQTIRNVAPGRVAADSTDAVNGAQLHALAQHVGDVDKRARAGIASAMASAGLPQAYRPGANMVAASAGHYDGQTAVAIGASTISDNGRWILKGTLNVNSKDAGATVGVGYQW